MCRAGYRSERADFSFTTLFDPTGKKKRIRILGRRTTRAQLDLSPHLIQSVKQVVTPTLVVKAHGIVEQSKLNRDLG